METSPAFLSYLNTVKKQEPENGSSLCGATFNHVDLITIDQQTQESQTKPVKGEESDEFLYCGDFRSYFTDTYDVHASSLFFDNPVPMEIDDPARQTLPTDFGLGKSDIPDEGIEMFKKKTISLDAHFKPFEEDNVSKEVMTSAYSWMLCGNATMESYTSPDHLAYLNPIKKEDPKDEGYLCGGTAMGLINSSAHHNRLFQSTPVNKGEPQNDEFLYCEVCKSYFTNMCEVHGPALFIFDTPIPMGIDDRARKTFPPGLELRKSGAGLSAFNIGETIPLGAHFGPYEGDLVDREEAMNSAYSWMIFKNGHCVEYIDAKREMYSNWMRYVNCAQNEREQNLIAIQYQGQIFYRCCQLIKSGQELLMWYDDNYGKDLGTQFDYLWKNKCSSNG